MSKDTTRKQTSLANDNPQIYEMKYVEGSTIVSEKTGRKLSETHEVKIRNITYIVTSEWKEYGQTAEDILKRLILRHASDAVLKP